MTDVTGATLRTTIAASLAAVSPAVEQRVIDFFVEKETAKRADAIVRGLDTLASFERELAKINRPDNKLLNADGSVQSEGYSQGRIDQIGKLNKKIGKLTEALDKALAGDMQALNNFKSDGSADDAE